MSSSPSSVAACAQWALVAREERTKEMRSDIEAGLTAWVLVEIHGVACLADWAGLHCYTAAQENEGAKQTCYLL